MCVLCRDGAIGSGHGDKEKIKRGRRGRVERVSAPRSGLSRSSRPPFPLTSCAVCLINEVFCHPLAHRTQRAPMDDPPIPMHREEPSGRCETDCETRGCPCAPFEFHATRCLGAPRRARATKYKAQSSFHPHRLTLLPLHQLATVSYSARLPASSSPSHRHHGATLAPVVDARTHAPSYHIVRARTPSGASSAGHCSSPRAQAPGPVSLDPTRDARLISPLHNTSTIDHHPHHLGQDALTRPRHRGDPLPRPCRAGRRDRLAHGRPGPPGQ